MNISLNMVQRWSSKKHCARTKKGYCRFFLSLFFIFYQSNQLIVSILFRIFMKNCEKKWKKIALKKAFFVLIFWKIPFIGYFISVLYPFGDKIILLNRARNALFPLILERSTKGFFSVGLLFLIKIKNFYQKQQPTLKVFFSCPVVSSCA